MNQTLYTLRHLRRLVCYSLSRHVGLRVTDQRVTHLVFLSNELQGRQPRLEILRLEYVITIVTDYLYIHCPFDV